jgi:hypothetical protein
MVDITHCGMRRPKSSSLDFNTEAVWRKVLFAVGVVLHLQLAHA